MQGPLYRGEINIEYVEALHSGEALNTRHKKALEREKDGAYLRVPKSEREDQKLGPKRTRTKLGAGPKAGTKLGP